MPNPRYAQCLSAALMLCALANVAHAVPVPPRDGELRIAHLSHRAYTVPQLLNAVRDAHRGRRRLPPQVAAQLGVSEQTVKSHMKSILAKLKANDRTHAVMIALDRGIINSWPAR